MGKVCCLGDEVKEGSYADLFTGAQVDRFRPAIRTRCHDNPPGAIRDIGRKLPGRVFPSSKSLRSNFRKIESKCFLIAGNENAIPYGDFRGIRPDHHVGWQGIHQLQ